jgi:hypothetical protein
MRRRLLLRVAPLVGLAGLSGLAGCAATAPGTPLLDVPADTPIRVRNTNGAVTVDSHGESRVVLTVTKRAVSGDGGFEDVSVETGVAGGGDGYLVETTYASESARRAASVDLDLVVPAGTQVAAVRTSNGRVDVRNTTGDLTAETGNGAIDVTDVDGFVTLSTGNGSVEVAGVAGVDGVEAGNGSIDVEVPAIRGDTTVETGNGTIDAALGVDLDADVLATTDLGSIDVEGLPLTRETVPARRVAGTLGDGGSDLRVRTGNGGIDLVALEP